MAQEQITYNDKSNAIPIVDRDTQATAEDFQDIKDTVNNNADDVNDRFKQEVIDLVANTDYTLLNPHQVSGAIPRMVQLKASDGTTILDAYINVDQVTGTITVNVGANYTGAILISVGWVLSTNISIPVPNSGKLGTTDWDNVAGTPDKWTGSGDGEVLSVENPVTDFINNVFKINSPVSDATLITDSFNVINGKTYKLRLRYWTPSLLTLASEFSAVLNASSPTILSVGTTTTDVTVVESSSFVADAGTLQIELYMATTGILYIDELELIEQ